MFKIQGGYAYNKNPIPETATIFNIQLPAINKNTISAGLTVAMTESVDLAFSLAYSLRNTNQGTILEIPGTAVVLKQDLTAINLGFRWRMQ
jgi:long-chain fatty acid transport protein